MLWLVLLTPPVLLASILGLAAVERRLFRAPSGSDALGASRLDTPHGAHSPVRETPAGSKVRDAGATPDAPSRNEALQPPLHQYALSRRPGWTSGATPVVRPSAHVERLLPEDVFTRVPGECVRCGGDLSRGFAVARDLTGRVEYGLVCRCCEWFDEAERQASGQ